MNRLANVMSQTSTSTQETVIVPTTARTCLPRLRSRACAYSRRHSLLIGTSSLTLQYPLRRVQVAPFSYSLDRRLCVRSACVAMSTLAAGGGSSSRYAPTSETETTDIDVDDDQQRQDGDNADAELRQFTRDELVAFDGKTPGQSIYVAVLGNVYDVSTGRKFYGPGTVITYLPTVITACESIRHYHRQRN